MDKFLYKKKKKKKRKDTPSHDALECPRTVAPFLLPDPPPSQPESRATLFEVSALNSGQWDPRPPGHLLKSNCTLRPQRAWSSCVWKMEQGDSEVLFFSSS